MYIWNIYIYIYILIGSRSPGLAQTDQQRTHTHTHAHTPDIQRRKVRISELVVVVARSLYAHRQTGRARQSAAGSEQVKVCLRARLSIIEPREGQVGENFT